MQKQNNNFIEIEDNTVEEAIAKGLKELNTTIENIDIQILRDAKNGFMSIGSQKALVRLTIIHTQKKQNIENKNVKESTINDNNEDYSPVILEIFKKILGFMGFFIEPKIVEMPSKYRIIVKDTDDANLLIGKNGKTIEALQHILNKILLIKFKTIKPIYIDIKGYVKQKRKNKIERKWKKTKRYSHK